MGYVKLIWGKLLGLGLRKFLRHVDFPGLLVATVTAAGSNSKLRK